MDSRDGRVRGMSGIAVAPFKAQAPLSARIATLESLREHLHWAIDTRAPHPAPLSLCAPYSLDAVRNPEASEVVASVLVEEMLHMTLAANRLNAVGETPRLDTPQMLPVYPRCLPHGDSIVRGSAAPLRSRGPGCLSEDRATGSARRSARDRRIRDNRPVLRRDPSWAARVLEGSVVMQLKGGPPVTLGPGQTFYEGPDDVHVVGRNASRTKPAKFLVFLVKDKGAPELVPVE